MITMNHDEQDGLSPRGDSCTECGTKFAVHLQFDRIYYMKPVDIVMEFVSEFVDDIEICVPVDNYGVCRSYKSPLS